MKNLILFILFLGMVQYLAAQKCVADAGIDKHNCWVDSSVQLGGSPTASGGRPPYTYEWSIDPIPFIPPNIPFLYASDILNDSTIANPKVLSPVELDSLAFYLKITDSLGCVSYDTIIVTTSFFGIHLAYYDFYINQGDSVYLGLGPNVYSAKAASFSWSPGHGLRDSTLYDGLWAKPDHDVAYSVTVTDSMGCSKTGGPVYYVYVRPLGTGKLLAFPSLKLFPNPSSGQFFMEVQALAGPVEVSVSDLPGRIILDFILEEAGTMNDVPIDLSSHPSGTYFLRVKGGNAIHFSRLIKE